MIKTEIKDDDLHTFDHFALDGGLMELLGFQHYSLFDVLPPVTLPPPEAVNLPATPNESSITSSSTDAPNESAVTEPTRDLDEDLETNKKSELKKTKKGKKRAREPRFAFLTKSEVDHLEDGYRWRKYGQKAVKNSPYPRSYYRCTTATCGVKKRVERSSEDPTVVVTTYEGQHTHASPAMKRGMHLICPRQTVVVPEQVGVLPLLHDNYLCSYLPQPMDFCNVESCDGGYYDPTAGAMVRDQGLLEDVIPSDFRKVED